MHFRIIGLGSGLLLLLAAPLRPQTPQFRVSHPDSYLLAITGKTGVLGFAGHEHAVLASQWSLDLSLNPSDLAHSTATVTIPAASLAIDTPIARRDAALGEGPSPEDIRTIQARMLGPEVLDAARYPTIQFTVTSVRQTAPGQLQVTGQFSLHGRSEPVTVPVRYRQEGTGAYVFTGEFPILQTGFGLKPESAGHGTVKVKDEVRIRFQVSVVPGA